MHPISKSLSRHGWTQQELADRVTKLSLIRPNGRPLILRQNDVSRFCLNQRRVDPFVAKAIGKVLGIKWTAIVLYRPVSQAA